MQEAPPTDEQQGKLTHRDYLARKAQLEKEHATTIQAAHRGGKVRKTASARIRKLKVDLDELEKQQDEEAALPEEDPGPSAAPPVASSEQQKAPSPGPSPSGGRKPTSKKKEEEAVPRTDEMRMQARLPHRRWAHSALRLPPPGLWRRFEGT